MRLLRRIGVDYVMVDLRLTTAMPGVGVYFDGGDADKDLRSPPQPRYLLKFNAHPMIGRLFDNGHHIIYDVRRLDDRN